MTAKTVLLMTNLDTRGAEFLRFKDLVSEQGLDPLLLDFSMEQEPPVAGDVNCDEVARAGGLDIETVRAKYRVERKTATDCMIRGATRLVRSLAEEGRIHGIFAAGGATATLISTSVMKSLPFGFPKVMASSIGSHPRYVDRYVGTRDITMLNTVVDVMGLNPLLEHQLRNGIGAICGMARLYEAPSRIGSDRGGALAPEGAPPVVAVTSFGFAERCVERVLELLSARGFAAVPFHAQGRGDRALDELVRDGLIPGVVDVCVRGLGEELLAGNCAAGPDRVLAAAEAGIPQVIAPSGLDMLSVGGRPEWRDTYEGRAFAIIDELRVEVRTTAEECRQMARLLADRLNRARAPYLVLLPLGGWSSLDREGAPLYDPPADTAFAEELAAQLDQPERIRTVEANLYSPEFGTACVEAFLEVWQDAGLARPVPA